MTVLGQQLNVKHNCLCNFFKNICLPDYIEFFFPYENTLAIEEFNLKVDLL